MGIQINGLNDNITSTDGSLTVTGYQLSGATNINTTGIITASTANFTGNVSIAGTLTYEDVTSVDSVGIITAQSDVSIADKIIHTGDTNTALRFPAADTFTVETGGSERLRITSDGSVGTGGLVASGGNLVVNSTIRSQNSSSNISYIGFAGYTGSTTVGSMFSYMGGDGRNTGYLNFSTNDTERLRITSNGNIGIGTDTPGTTKLKIETGSGTRAISLNAPTNGTYITFETAGTAYADIGAEKGVVGSGSADTPVINARGSRDISFRTNSSERLRISSNGNIGIGTDDPDSTLHIQSPSGSTTLNFTAPSGQPNKLQFRLNNGTLDAEIKNESAGLIFSTGTTPTARLTISSSGAATFSGLMKAGSAQIETSSTATNNLYGGNSYFGGTGSGSGSATASILSTGAAKFAAAVNIGANTGSSSIDADGAYLDPNGTVYSFKAAASTTPFFQAYKKNSGLLAEITHSGSATFDDNVESGGIFKSDRSNSANDCFQAKNNGTINANITAAGAANFAGNVTSTDGVQSGGNSTAGWSLDPGSTSAVIGVQGKSNANGGADGNALFQGWHGATNTIRFNCDGTANFAGRINAGYDGGSATLSNYAIAAYNSHASAATIYAQNANASGKVWHGYNASAQTSYITTGGSAWFGGSLSKGSGSFKISHPLPAKTATHDLVHSFIEGPQADLIYSGMVTLVAGKAEINLDTAARMTEGTFLLLNTNLRRFVSNEGGWTAVKSSITGNVLTVEAQDDTCTDEVFWTVIGERKDQHMIDTEWTDGNGRVITEPLKSVEEES